MFPFSFGRCKLFVDSNTFKSVNWCTLTRSFNLVHFYYQNRKETSDGVVKNGMYTFKKPKQGLSVGFSNVGRL